MPQLTKPANPLASDEHTLPLKPESTVGVKPQSTKPPRFINPRKDLSRRIEKLSASGTSDYAQFIRAGKAGGHIPCWGAIAERFEQTFESDNARAEVLDALIKSADRRPLYLFLHTSRRRPALMEVLCARASRLPVSVQRCLVAMPEAEPFVEDHLAGFGPAARAVWRAGEDGLKKEREHLAVRVNELLAFRYFVPDSKAPETLISKPQKS